MQYIDIRKTQQQFDNAYRKLLGADDITPRSKELLKQFIRDCRLGAARLGRSRRCGAGRLAQLVYQLHTFAGYVRKDLDAVDMHDMEQFIGDLDSGALTYTPRPFPNPNPHRPTPTPRPYSLSTRPSIKASIRKFYTWLHGNPRNVPDLVAWFDFRSPLPEIPALSYQEIDLLIDASSTLLQKTVIQTLFDSGCRLGELLNIRLKHVRYVTPDRNRPHEQCYSCRVPYSKTKPRTVVMPMPRTTRFLTLWLQAHPDAPRMQADGTLTTQDPNRPLFCISPLSIRDMLHKLGKNILGKRVYPHLLRHSSATFWAPRLPYFQFCKRFGWTLTSSMPQRYIDREGIDDLATARIYRDYERIDPTGDGCGQAVSPISLLSHTPDENIIGQRALPGVLRRNHPGSHSVPHEVGDGRAPGSGTRISSGHTADHRPPPYANERDRRASRGPPSNARRYYDPDA